jgi:glutamine amidotransferase PdxT
MPLDLKERVNKMAHKNSIVTQNPDGSIWCSGTGYTFEQAKEEGNQVYGKIVRPWYGKQEGSGLRFDVEFDRGASAFGIACNEPDITTILRKADVEEIKELDGKTVIAYYDGGLAYGFHMQ